MSVSIDLSGLEHFLGRMTNFAARIGPSLDKYKKDEVERLLQLVIKHASGRPGPNVVTGAYISSFVIVEDKVVNHSPQTHRLEYGFVGSDSLGRNYHQPAFPHFRPALQEIKGEYVRGIVPVVKQTWRES